MGALVKPSALPQWATDPNITDPTSGEKNVVDPGSSRYAEGWLYNEKPPRNYMNWLHNLYYQWIALFDANFDQSCNVGDNVQFGTVLLNTISDSGGGNVVISVSGNIVLYSPFGILDIDA